MCLMKEALLVNSSQKKVNLYVQQIKISKKFDDAMQQQQNSKIKISKNISSLRIAYTQSQLR